MDHAGLQPRSHRRGVLSGPVAFCQLRDCHSGPPFRAGAGYAPENACAARRRGGLHPEWAPKLPYGTSHLLSDAGGSFLLKDLKDRLIGLFLSRFPMKYTPAVHYVENSCILWVAHLGICTFSMQNNYNLFYNPNPNISMMTYFYPRKHDMATRTSGATAKPSRLPRTGPPLMRPQPPNLNTDSPQGQ